MQERIRLAPDHTDYNLISVYAFLNRFDEAQALLERQQNDGPFLRETRYALAFLRGDGAAMQEQLTWAMGKPDAEDSLLSAQSETEAYYGRLATARQFSQEAVQSAKHAEALDRAADWRANEALREAEIGNLGRARQLAAEVLALSAQPDVQVKAALALARAGDAAHARKLADKLNHDRPLDTRMQNYSLPAIRAAIEIGKNNGSQAIQMLQVATPYELGSTSAGIHFLGSLYPVYLRGLAYLQTGQGQLAAAEFQKVLDHRGIIGNFVFGALAHLQLGRAEAMMGNKEAARKSYRDFLALWKDADPDVPVVRAAKAEYAKLN
jgi:hypothetical protein